jgi:hypothetical protein
MKKQRVEDLQSHLSGLRPLLANRHVRRHVANTARARRIPAPTGEHLDTLMSDGRNATLIAR